jgi:anti-sigma factor RsiW
MSLCQSIDTLAMAYLDDELAPEERRELELHLHDCASCKQQVESDRAELDLVRNALVAPPAPDLLKARIARVLDEEDRDLARQTRRRYGAWLLPGSAMAVAVAALVFVAFAVIQKDSSSPTAASPPVTQEAVRQTRSRNSLPLEVQGPNTGAWLQQHFTASQIRPPEFGDAIQLLGARLSEVAGHEAALVQYVVSTDHELITLTAVLIDRVQPEDLSGGVQVRVGNRIMHLHDANGYPAVTYVDEDGLGYAFTSERLSAPELVQLIANSDLVGRTQQGR